MLSCLALSSCCIYYTKQTTGCTAGVTETIPKHIKLTNISQNLRYEQVGKTQTVMQFFTTSQYYIYHSHSHKCTHLQSTWITLTIGDKLSLVRFSMYCMYMCVSVSVFLAVAIAVSISPMYSRRLVFEWQGVGLADVYPVLFCL